jgi:RNA polymerase sigma-70 factor (ECF subfamily)
MTWGAQQCFSVLYYNADDKTLLHDEIIDRKQKFSLISPTFCSISSSFILNSISLSSLSVVITQQQNQTESRENELQQLIDGCKAGDRRCQEMLYRKFYGRMMTTCLRYTSNPDDALEALNNGFLKVFRNLSQYKGSGSFDGWVYNIVRNSVIDHLRKRLKYSETASLETAEAESIVTENACEQMDAAALLKLLDILPEATRTVFNLFAIEGFGHKEIGKLLGISEGTSKWHVAQARKQLQDCIKKQYPHLIK